MKLSFLRNFGKSIVMQILSFIFILVIGIGAVYAWTVIDRNSAASGQPLTSTMMQGIIDRVNDALVPTGAVMAFNLAACPTGWSEYTPAYGRFIRGIDKSGTAIDPDGLRTPGSLQADAFQGHRHKSFRGEGWTQGTYYLGLLSTPSGTEYDTVFDPISDGTNGTPRTASETRSKNVALLYCQKS